jgi:hypothetical protein
METVRVFTSYFGNLRKLPAGTLAVGIAVGPPPWFRGPSYKALAPTRLMLRMSEADYNHNFNLILADNDPTTVIRDLRALAKKAGASAVALCCWERPGESCHRRRVAEWLEDALGIEVAEVGHPRAETPAYNATPWPVKGAAKTKTPKAPTTLSLF